MNRKPISFAAISALLLTATLLPMNNSLAASSDWQDTDGARLRIVTQSQPDESGLIKAIIEVDLEQGWKTYWREPGSSGIPPYFDFSQSENVEKTTVHYPVPVMIHDDAGDYAGYKKSISFPIDIQTKNDDQTARIQADIFLGVCNDICVPFSAKIDLDLKDFQTTKAHNELIEGARFRLPTAPSADFNLKNVEYNQLDNSVEFELTLPALYPPNIKPELFVHGPLKWPMSQPKMIDTTDGSVRFRSQIFDAPTSDNPVEGPLYVLLKLGQRSAETTLNLGSYPLCQRDVDTKSC